MTECLSHLLGNLSEITDPCENKINVGESQITLDDAMIYELRPLDSRSCRREPDWPTGHNESEGKQALTIFYFTSMCPFK